MCDLHFESTSVKQTPFGKKKTLLPNAQPSLHAWNNWGNDRLQAKCSEPPCTDNLDLFQSAGIDTADAEVTVLKKQMLDLRKENLILINENRKLTEDLLIRNKNIERLYC